jgi:hypothetical protein
MAECMRYLIHRILFTIAIFCMGVLTVAFMFTFAQLGCVLMGVWP